MEGVQGTAEAIATGRVEALFYAGDEHDSLAERAAASGARVFRATPAVMGHLTSAVTPQGVVAVLPFVDVALEEAASEPRLVALLHAVRDPGNAGTIVRSADAAGADAVVFSEQSVDVYNPKAVRASAGSIFHVPIVRDADLEGTVRALRERGMQVLAADAHGEKPLHAADLSSPTAVLFGNEAWGLSAEVAALADATVRIPIRGRAESLNLAAAATIFLYEAARAGEHRSSFARRVAAAGHDLRAHLTAMTGFARMLASRGDDVDARTHREMVDGILRGAQRVGVALGRVVDAARVEAGTMQLAPEPVELAEVARRAAVLLDDGPPVEVAGTAAATGDRDRLVLATLALLEAAAHAAPGPVSVRVEERGGEARLEVAAGAEPAALEHEDTGGELALALDLAAAVAAAHGGRLERSRSALVLALPATSRGAPEPAR